MVLGGTVARMSYIFGSERPLVVLGKGGFNLSGGLAGQQRALGHPEIDGFLDSASPEVLRILF